jgi:Rps23 Pro-64 3,4-dihydroxylase Tpa1-like proline 4-hydroxylase
MEFNYYNVLNLPVVVVDNFYDDRACQLIWQELCFLNNDNKLLRPEETGSALDINTNAPLKNNIGITLDEIYLDRNVSNILKESRKIFFDEIADCFIDFNVFFRYLRASNLDTTIVQYYENSNFYESHTDSATITAIAWFYDQPKKFQGGQLMFEDGSTIECRYNRMVLFPSILFHSVEPISVKEDDRNRGVGRYSITQLISLK